MKKKIIFLCFSLLILLSSPSFAQGSGEPYHPMTAPGAIGIDNSEHTLFWENPTSVQYNECYFSSDSSLVANMDTSVRIQNGYPSTVFDSAPLSNYGTLNYNTKYFWRVVEYNASGNSISPVWYFRAVAYYLVYDQIHFDSDLEGWVVYGPYGFDNWYWQNTSLAGGENPGEMVFSRTPLFIGDSYIMSPEIPAPADRNIVISFKYFEDWRSDTVAVGCAYTTNNGNSWTSIWELHATGNVGPEFADIELNIPGNFHLGFYYTGNSNNIDFFYVDDLSVDCTLAVTFPPTFLQAEASTNEQKVVLQWNSGWSPWPYTEITGYRLQRKNGLPTDNSSYVTIATTDSNTYSFEDYNVELNHTYTYRVCTLSFIGYQAHFYGNEATAYVPDELTSVKTETELPSEFSLAQNYPNPFNPTTKIKYSVPSVETHRDALLQVTLKVYDLLGNEVATLVNEQKPAGTYEVEFDGKDLTSGIYFYQLKAGSLIDTKKMVLLR